MNTRKQNTWTTQRFINLSNDLAAGYSTAIERQTVRRQDTWTAEALINMSNGFAQF